MIFFESSLNLLQYDIFHNTEKYNWKLILGLKQLKNASLKKVFFFVSQSKPKKIKRELIFNFFKL